MTTEPPRISRRARCMDYLMRRAEDMKGNLRLVVIGAGIFFSGAGLLLWADHSLTPSVTQELAGLLALCLMIGGGLTALIGYLGLSILRLIKILKDKNE